MFPELWYLPHGRWARSIISIRGRDTLPSSTYARRLANQVRIPCVAHLHVSAVANTRHLCSMPTSAPPASSRAAPPSWCWQRPYVSPEKCTYTNTTTRTTQVASVPSLHTGDCSTRPRSWRVSCRSRSRAPSTPPPTNRPAAVSTTTPAILIYPLISLTTLPPRRTLSHPIHFARPPRAYAIAVATYACRVATLLVRRPRS